MCSQDSEVHQDRYTRTLVHIVGAEQSHVDHMVQDGRTRPVGGQTKRGKRHTAYDIDANDACIGLTADF